MNIYDALFGDQDLDEVLLDAHFDGGSKLHAARARLWEGNVPAATAELVGAPQPWATFIAARASVQSGQGARPLLQSVANDPTAESRPRLWAWTALRKLGERELPPDVLGLVIEVPMNGDFDTLAAYQDGSVRFLGHAGQARFLEPEAAPAAAVAALLGHASLLLAVPPSPRVPSAPPPPDLVRLSALSPAGVHATEVPWSDLEPPAPYSHLFAAATALFQDITAL
jgi:hypothetical protein